MCCSSGGNNSSPDYGPMAAASEESARVAKELGEKQLAETQRQYENNMAVARPVVDAQLGLMKAQKEQGDELYDYHKNTFRPVEEGLVKDATEFNTADAKERFARQAATDLQTQQANQEGQERRAMTSMGVNPNSGRFQGLESARRITSAAQRAGATTNARVHADSLGWAKRMDAAGLGRNLTGASQASYGLAANAGTQAVGNNAQAGNAMVAGTSSANGTVMQGQAMRINGLSTVLSGQNNNYNANLNATTQNNAGLGQLAGAGLGAAASYFSDRRVKENIDLVGQDSSSGLNLYEFNYIGDQRRFRGVMADEVETLFPDAVSHDDKGVAVVDYGRIGIEMVEV